MEITMRVLVRIAESRGEIIPEGVADGDYSEFMADSPTFDQWCSILEESGHVVKVVGGMPVIVDFDSVASEL